MSASQSVPGPRALPVLGPTAQLLRFVLDPIAHVGRLFEQYGPIAQLVVGSPTRIVSTERKVPGTVFLYGPEYNRALLTNHTDFHKCALSGPLWPEEPLTARTRPLTRMLTGLFHANEADHRTQRRLLMPAFHRSRIESYRDEMVAVTDALLAEFRPGQIRDLRPDMMRVTLRIATSTLFGGDLGPLGLQIGHDLESWNANLRAANIVPFDLPFTPYRRWLDVSSNIDRRILEVIRIKRENPGDGRDMLSMLIEARDEGGAQLSEDELVGHAGVIFAAGHETSSNALSWTLLMLAQHPEILADLCDELSGKLRGAAAARSRDQRELAAIPTRADEPSHHRARQRAARLSNPGRHRGPEQHLPHPPHAGFVSRAAALPPRAVARTRPRTLRLQPLQRRPAHVHRRNLRVVRNQNRARALAATLSPRARSQPTHRSLLRNHHGPIAARLDARPTPRSPTSPPCADPRQYSRDGGSARGLTPSWRATRERALPGASRRCAREPHWVKSDLTPGRVQRAAPG